MKRTYRRPLTQRIFLTCFLFVLILSVVMGLIGFLVFRSRMLQQFESHIRDIINLTVSQIDVEDLDECIRTGEASEEFEELTAFVDQVRVNYNLDSIVLTKPVKEGNTYDMLQVVAGLFPEERAGQQQKDIEIPLLGDHIGQFMPEDVKERAYSELMDCHEIRFSTSKSDFGNSYNGALGIYKEDGTPVALLTSGLSLEFIDTTMQQYLLVMIFATLILSFLFANFMMIWFRKRVTKPLGDIEEAAREFENKTRTDVDPKTLKMNFPELHSGDELESLSNTLTSMSKRMKEFVEEILESLIKVGHLEKDLDASKRQATEYNELANRDALTGIRNKLAYDKEVERVVWDLSIGKTKFGVAMIDLNFLKRINDTFGHEKGNISIVKLCHLVCVTFAHSPVFRIGGDEFAVILKGTDYDNVEALVEQFNTEIEKASNDETLEHWERTSAAIGYALYDETIDSGYDNVFRRADRAMYERKSSMKALR